MQLSTFRIVLFSLVFSVLTGSVALTQQSTGSVLGTITDAQGAVVPGVTITVTNAATRTAKTATSDKDGNFQVLDLPIGTYIVTAEHAGFAKIQTDAQTLQINQNIRLDIRMKVGTQQEVVDVTGTASGVETVNSTLGQSVTSRPIIDLPLNGRDVLQLALLQPGVTETNADNTSQGNFSIAGGRTDSVTFLLDGGVNNDLLDNGVVFSPNPDTVAEFRILQNNYSAEYGRNGGGVISVVTKSGTNSLHGTGFEFLRNDALNANSFFNNAYDVPRDVLKRNQFGGTLGGRIKKDKLFFFVSYEGQRLTQKQNPSYDGASATTQVFTTAELTEGDFSKTEIDPNTGLTYVADFLKANPYFVAPGHTYADSIIDPTKFDPIAQKYIAAGLIPSSASGIEYPTASRYDNFNELSVKLDYAITPKDQLSTTFGGHKDTYSDNFFYATTGGYPNIWDLNNYFTNIAYTRTISSTMLNELRFTAQRTNKENSLVSGSNTQYTASALGVGITPDQPTGPPNITFDTGLELGYSYGGPTTEADNTFSYADTFSWVKGKHTLKFGAGFTPYQNNTLYDYFVNGQFAFVGQGGIGTGNSFADFLLGIPNNFAQYPSAPSNIRSKNTYAFAQDEWHVNRRLVLNLGVRYEYSTPKLDTQGRSFSVIPGEQSTVFPGAPLGLVFPGDQGAPAGANFPDKLNFAPRIGFALDPTGSGKTSLRGGFGVFYDVLKGEDNLQFNGQSPFFSSAGLYFSPPANGATSNYTYLSDPFNNPSAGTQGLPNPFPSKPVNHDIDWNAAGFLPFNNGGSVYIVDPRLRTPYVMQYNLSLEHEVASKTTADLTYVGSQGRKLTSLVDVDPFDLSNNSGVRLLNEQGGNIPACDGMYGYCFAQMPEFKNVSNESYNALEASVTRQPSTVGSLGDVYFTFGYTYAHNIDNASGFRQRNSGVPYYDTDAFRTSSDLDMRHRVTISGGWDLALDKWWESGWKKVTQGWSIFPIFTWHTGFPFDIPADFGDAYDPTNPGPSGAGDANLAHANLVGPSNTLNPRATYSFGSYYWFNPNSFSNNDNCEYAGSPNCQPGDTPYSTPYGTLPRNYLRAPDYTNLDLEIAKSTKLTERVTMQLRAEMFNVLNHAQFKSPDTNITSSQFGQLTSTYDPRIIQVAVRLSF